MHRFLEAIREKLWRILSYGVIEPGEDEED